MAEFDWAARGFDPKYLKTFWSCGCTGDSSVLHEGGSAEGYTYCDNWHKRPNACNRRRHSG